jgi:hypothetical protein
MVDPLPFTANIVTLVCIGEQEQNFIAFIVDDGKAAAIELVALGSESHA